MINVYANFKYVDANDDSCPHDLDWISDELTLTFEDEKVNPFLFKRFEHLITKIGFHSDGILTYSLCYSERPIDDLKHVKDGDFRYMLRNLEIRAADLDIHICWDADTKAFIDGDLAYIEIVNTHCKWVENIDILYKDTYKYNTKALRYDPTKRDWH